ncbi:MAG: phosphoenolpyruvate carboxykinase (ATP) [Candidatus Cloacimonadota bacterium]|nr:MAG: phosphoenolpyruvate carboxykinase (ATP) [Candidatus Cloacimonadota bacterium]
MSGFDLSKQKISEPIIKRNLAPTILYGEALSKDDSHIASTGALIVMSGEKTGRSPKAKRVVEEETSKKNIWWGNINIPFSEKSFFLNKSIAQNWLNSQKELYVVDGYAGWDPKHRISVRIICARPYHALFMHNMLIRPTKEELISFEPEWVIYNAGQCNASTEVEGVTDKTSVNLNIKDKTMVILGTEYAGEMKKGVFTIMNYLLPAKNQLSMHCSANEGKDGDVALFFGLSGTGKTTLSADPKRALIGDDEHGWTQDGIFNFEGGCYAKTIDLEADKEPEIWDAIRFGSVLENVGYDKETGVVDYTDVSITQNTRTSYPIEYIENAKIPCVGGHPKNVIFLTCDAFGVLPPVSKLTNGQAMYHFISGYTAKVAGTEMGVTDPEATFSACFGAAFMVWHPTKYAEILRDYINKNDTNVWLVNTGWTGGSFGVGSRFSLKYTRAIIDGILSGDLAKAKYSVDPIFGLATPDKCSNVPSDVLNPVNTWSDKDEYHKTANKLAKLFNDNFETYKDQADEEILAASPKVS